MIDLDLDYFNGLSIREILELARKSIRITAENRKMEDKLEEIQEDLSIIIKNCNIYPLKNNLIKILKKIGRTYETERPTKRYNYSGYTG